MPFLGKDWRSSGDQWVRTEHGWERCKALECILDNLSIGLRREKLNSKQKKSNEDESDSRKDDLSSLSPSVKFTLHDGEEENEGNKEEKNENANEYDDDDDEEDLSDLDMFEEIITTDDEEKHENTDDTNNLAQEKGENDLHNSKRKKRNSNSLTRLSLSNGSIERYNHKTRQPHIIFYDFDVVTNRRENQKPKATISDVLTALDMPGAVRDIKRFNYVCRLVQIIINEKLHHLSGNAQRTLFMIVKQMLIQVIKTQENLNVMRKLLFDFKKKIQDSFFYHFYYVGSQKIGDKHLATITKWQDLLDNPNHKRVKRLTANRATLNNYNHFANKKLSNSDKENNDQGVVGFEKIPLDCKIEIMRRLNTGLDLINLSKCNKNLNDIINKELAIWKNLCQFHFQQTNINSLLNKTSQNQQKNLAENASDNDLDWKEIYFKLKKRYGHREVYADMIHKCLHCKCLFWKEIGHPCLIMDVPNTSTGFDEEEDAGSFLVLEMRTEPITPKKLIDLLLK